MQWLNNGDNMRIAADYTTRANYQDNYRKANRDAINARKRAWRKANKLKQAADDTASRSQSQGCPETARI